VSKRPKTAFLSGLSGFGAKIEQFFVQTFEENLQTTEEKTQTFESGNSI